MSADQLKRISDKLQELLKKHDLLKKENERLRAELVPAKQRELAFMEQIASLEQKILVLKAGNSSLSEVEKKELDRKIHTYLKEIDKCISMLSE
jgi:hypothetical protein